MDAAVVMQCFVFCHLPIPGVSLGSNPNFCSKTYKTVQKVQQGSRRYKKVQKDSKRYKVYKKIKKVTKWLKKVQKRSIM